MDTLNLEVRRRRRRSKHQVEWMGVLYHLQEDSVVQSQGKEISAGRSMRRLEWEATMESLSERKRRCHKSFDENHTSYESGHSMWMED